MGSDPYVYPNSNVLINNFNIRDAEKLDQAERLITRVSMRQPLPNEHSLTMEGFKEIHKHIFKEIYPWAGEFRNINLRRADQNIEFERGPFVEINMRRVFLDLRDDKYLQGLDRDTFSYRAAVYLTDINFTHPFREGNGRTQRLFLEHLAKQAGHKLDQSRVDIDKWYDASKKSFQNEHGLMTETIKDAIVGPEKEKQRIKSPELEEALDKANSIKNHRQTEIDHDKDQEKEM